MGCFLNKKRKKYIINIVKSLLEDSQIKLFYIDNKSTNQKFLEKKGNQMIFLFLGNFLMKKKKKSKFFL